MTGDRDLALDCTAWPFREARKLLERTGGKTPEKGYVLLETGYGPSGLPHIGTFGEVVRTSMVRHAFSLMSDAPTRLFAFSDDMDGLRAVPDNVPDKDAMALYAEERAANGMVTRNGTPLTSVPDPFGTHESFGQHNNERLKAFLDRFGFDYEFKSATECYKSGLFDETLIKVLERFNDIMAIMLPTLRPQRRATYSPFLPIVERDDERLDNKPRLQVLHHAVIKEVDVSRGKALFQEMNLEDGTPIGQPFEHPVTGGRCKLQWRVDWAMRWVALGVDYEMSGKDLIDSVRDSGAVCRVLGGTPPEGFTYELFLDANGEKISKSKGNGLTIDEWLRYGSPESLSLFMYNAPRKAKRLHFDVIPRHVDDYAGLLAKFIGQTPAERLHNPVWHIHGGAPPTPSQPLSYAVLLNLASVTGAEDKSALWGFISRYVADASPETAPMLDELAGYAVNYYTDFVKPNKRYRAPDARERAALEELANALETLPDDGEAIQYEVYEIGKRHGFEPLRAWFKALYETLLGQAQGPRMGSFIALYGRAETIALIRRVLAGERPDAA